MKLNSKHISQFGAKLVDYTISGTSTTSCASEIMRYGIQRTYGTKTGNKSITINLTFRPIWFPPLHYRPSIHERLHRVTEQISQFDSEIIINDIVTLELPNGYTYLCTLDKLGTPVDDGSAVHDSTYTFIGVQVLPMLTVSPRSGFINCTSNVETDCIITITANSAIATAEVFGVQINNIADGDTVVIDGIKKTVLCNNENKFSDTELISFPTLLPGANVITVSPADKINVSISYYPTFV